MQERKALIIRYVIPLCTYIRTLHFAKIISNRSLGRNGDALVNCYESRSVAASTRYYRYKRNGEGDAPASAATVSEVSTSEATASEAPATEASTVAAVPLIGPSPPVAVA